MEPKNYNRGFVEKLIATEIAFGEDISWFLGPAIRNGHGAIVELLLRLGADIDSGATHALGYHTLLHIAVLYENEAMVKLLVDNGANIEKETDYDRLTPLHLAATKTSPAIIDLLLEIGANLEASTRSRNTPLYEAAQNANVAIIDLLLEKGANIEASNSRREYTIAHGS